MKVIWNNRIVDEHEVSIHREDRGYQFGDGLYEVIRIYNGKLFMADEHFDRLFNGANKIKLAIPYTKEQMLTTIQQLIAEDAVIDGYIYFQISRGVKSPRSHAFPSKAETAPVWTANVNHLPRLTELQSSGLTAATVEDKRWLNCDIKSLSLLGNLLSLEEAKEKSAEDALLHRNGMMTEASASNAWFVKDNIIYTHPDGNLILPGITKMAIKAIIEEKGYQFIEQAYPLEHVEMVDECFISNSVWEIVPVTKINQQMINHGKIGPITKKLQEAYIALSK